MHLPCRCAGPPQSVYLVMEPIKARRLRTHVEGVMRQEVANMRSALGSLETAVRAQAAGGGPAAAPVAGATAAAMAAAAAAGADSSIGVDLAARSELLGQLRQLRVQLAAVEEGLAGTAGGQVGGPARVAHGSEGAAPLLSGPAGLALSANDGIAGDGEVDEGVEEREHGAGRGAGTWVRGRWLGWYHGVRLQMRRALATPEVTTAVAAFVGATLGVSVLLVLRGSN